MKTLLGVFGRLPTVLTDLDRLTMAYGYSYSGTADSNAPAGKRFADLLVPVFRAGEVVYDPPSIGESRDLTRRQLSMLHDGIKRFDNPHVYPVGLEKGLHDLKTELVMKARGVTA